MPYHEYQDSRLPIPGLPTRASAFQGVPGFSEHVNSILGGLGVPRRFPRRQRVVSLQFPGGRDTAEEEPFTAALAGLREPTAREYYEGTLYSQREDDVSGGELLEGAREAYNLYNLFTEGKRAGALGAVSKVGALDEIQRRQRAASQQSGAARPDYSSNPNLQDLTLAALSTSLQVTPRNYLGRRTAL